MRFLSVPTFRSVLAASGLLLASGISPSAAEVPRVVATILPIHGVVADVMKGVGEPQLLLPAGASPHAFSLKPSDARKLANADVIIWAGDELESFLARPLRNAASRTTVLKLTDQASLVRHPVREGGIWDAHDHGDGHGDGHHGHGHHGHGHGKHDGEKDGQHGASEWDPHFWTDPENGIRMAGIIAEVLAKKNPANAAVYRQNAQNAIASYKSLMSETASKLAGVKSRSFIVFHDAYQYFEKRFGLAGAGSITISPERKPGAKRLQRLRDRIVKSDAICVFAEPQFRPTQVDALIRGTSAKAGSLDPLGVGIEPGAGALQRLISKLSDDLLACLKPSA